MIGIEQIASYIPTLRQSNFEKKLQFGIDDNFIEKKIGVHFVSRKSKDEDTSDLCLRAFEKLKNKSDISINAVDCIVVCTQNPDGHGIPHTSAILHGKIGGNSNCAAFDISLGCTGFVHSLNIITAFMNANGMQKGLLFTADPYSKIIDPDDKNTALLFGDAASVTLLTNNPVLKAGYFSFRTAGKECFALQYMDNHLQMNGRAVFNFSATVVPQQIKGVLEKSGDKIEDIDLFLFHQGSKYVVDIIRQRLLLEPQKVPINLADHGNTISSSIPILLENYLHQENYRKILISGFGVGLAATSCILERIWN